MAPVFDSSVFDAGVFDTDEAGMSATLSGSGTMSGALKPAVILLAGLMTGSGTIQGALATEILLSAILTGSGEMSGNLKVARPMGRLTTCGEPLTTHCQDWILGNDDPRRNG